MNDWPGMFKEIKEIFKNLLLSIGAGSTLFAAIYLLL